jgi:hypothetical protein
LEAQFFVPVLVRNPDPLLPAHLAALSEFLADLAGSKALRGKVFG